MIMKKNLWKIMLLTLTAVSLLRPATVSAFSFPSIKDFFTGDQKEATPREKLESRVIKAIERRKEEITIHKSDELEESGIWDQIRDTVSDIVIEDPQLYWVNISTGYNLFGGTKEEQDAKDSVTFSLTYLDETEVEKRQKEIDEAAREILAKIPENDSDWEKAKKVHDLLISEITYEDGEDDGNLYGALVKKKSVCNGYCMAYEYLLTQLGIECDTVVGYTSEMGKKLNESSIFSLTGSHAWNEVTITEDGEKKSFYVDVTWDDRDEKDSCQEEYVSYQWFGFTAEDMERVGRCKMLDEGKETDDNDDCSYYTYMDAWMDQYDQEEITGAFMRQLESGNNMLTLRWRTWDGYREAMTSLIDDGQIYDILRSVGIEKEQYRYEATGTIDYHNLYILNVYL